MREEKIRTNVQSSRSGAIITELELSEEHAGDIANFLWDMCLEESVVSDLSSVQQPSESKIACCIAVNLERQANQLEEFGKILAGYSAMKLQAARRIEFECLAD